MTHENDTIGELIGLTDRLAAVMVSEVELLRAMRAGEIGALQEEKARLAAAYASALETVRKTPALIEGCGADRRAALEEATARMSARVDENLCAVKAAQIVNELLIRTLGAAVAEMQTPAGAYTASGAAAAAGASSGQVPLALDHQI